MNALKFWDRAAIELLRELDDEGGYLVAPSAPSLCQAAMDASLWQSHLKADYAVVDSAYMRVLYFLTGQIRLPRISGHQLIDRILHEKEDCVPFQQRRLLWVLPQATEGDRIRQLLDRLGFESTLQEFYVAPFYRCDADFQDAALAGIVSDWKPDWVILCIGGGRQEKLGAFLRLKFGRRPVVMATGGAISFFSGGQAPIPKVADRLFLGWLVRIIHDPRRFLPRYLGAVFLPLALWRLRKMSSSAGHV